MVTRAPGRGDDIPGGVAGGWDSASPLFGWRRSRSRSPRRRREVGGCCRDGDGGGGSPTAARSPFPQHVTVTPTDAKGTRAEKLAPKPAGLVRSQVKRRQSSRRRFSRLFAPWVFSNPPPPPLLPTNEDAVTKVCRFSRFDSPPPIPPRCPGRETESVATRRRHHPRGGIFKDRPPSP